MQYSFNAHPTLGQRTRASFAKLLIGSALVAASWAQAQALPSPKDIENAVEAGRYTQA